MKKLILITLVLLISLSINAQFKGFFKPVNQVVARNLTLQFKSGETIKPEWLFRPSITLTALAVDFKGGAVQSFNSAGLGLSYSKFSNTAYCLFSINGLFLTSVELGGTITSSKVGGAITVDVFNKLVGAGIAYIDKPMLLLTVSYSF